MAQKTIKKNTKKTTARASVKASATRSMPTKSVAKSTKRVVRATNKNADVMETKTACACGEKCHCCCCCGHRVIRWCIKVILLCIVFVAGMAVAPLFMHDKPMHHMEFDDNGCVVLESVKCPKMLETLSVADTNADGCISREEIESAKHEMRRAKHADVAADADMDIDQ